MTRRRPTLVATSLPRPNGIRRLHPVRHGTSRNEPGGVNPVKSLPLLHKPATCLLNSGCAGERFKYPGGRFTRDTQSGGITEADIIRLFVGELRGVAVMRVVVA